MTTEFLGYPVPVTYSAGLEVNSTWFTVTYDGSTYAAAADAVPFTTTSDFDTRKWSVIQGVTAADLASSTGAGLIGSTDGRTLQAIIDQFEIESITDLRNIEPTFDGQRVKVGSRIGSWSSAANNTTPWGGGEFVYVAEFDVDTYPDDDGAIIRTTTGGKAWVRASLVEGNDTATVYAEWFSDVPPTLIQDWSDAVNAANNSAEGLIKSLNPKFGRMIRLVTPKLWGLSKSVIININGVWLDGNHGSCLVQSGGSYSAHPQAASTSNAASATAAADMVYAIGLIASTISTDASNYACYYERRYVRDLSITCGNSTDPYKFPYSEKNASSQISANPLIALCHFGNAPTSGVESNVTGTVQTGQGEMSGVAVNGFDIGYSNGDYAWGVNWWGCKFTGCGYVSYLLGGSDNGERIAYLGCVMQNGWNGVYKYSWGGDLAIEGGSMVWMTGTYFYVGTNASGFNDIHPSRLEYVNSVSPIVDLQDAALISSSFASYATTNFRPILTLVSRTSATTTAWYFFNAGLYRTLKIKTNWRWSSYTDQKNMQWTNQDSTGRYIWEGNQMQIGNFYQPKQWELSMRRSMLKPYKTSSLYAVDTSNSAYTYSFDTTNEVFTLTCTADNSGAYFASIYVPVDVPITHETRNIASFLKFTEISVTSDWIIAIYLGEKQTGTEYKVGDIYLKSFTNSPDKVYVDQYDWPKVHQDIYSIGFAPTYVRFNIYISASVGGTSGETFSISDGGLLAT